MIKPNICFHSPPTQLHTFFETTPPHALAFLLPDGDHVQYSFYLLVLGHSGANELPSHGSVFTPDQYGTAGCRGNSDGGKGGGLIFMEIGDELYVDGTIANEGQDAASGANAGGGSGGSTW